MESLFELAVLGRQRLALHVRKTHRKPQSPQRRPLMP